jgi:hypothetical protein
LKWIFGRLESSFVSISCPIAIGICAIMLMEGMSQLFRRGVILQLTTYNFFWKDLKKVGETLFQNIGAKKSKIADENE